MEQQGPPFWSVPAAEVLTRLQTASQGLSSAEAVARIVGASVGGPCRVLDIAAGHGLFGITIARHNPQAEIVALDWASVLEVAKENAHKAGIESRYSTIAGSAFEADFGDGYDIVLLTNFLHHFDSATNVRLLSKCRKSLKPGGRAAVLEFVPNEDRITPPFPAAFSMTMLEGTPSGDAYTLRELTQMALAAGYRNVQSHPLEYHPETVLVFEN